MEETNHLNGARSYQNTFDAFAAPPSTALLVRPPATEDDELTIESPETEKEVDDTRNISLDVGTTAAQSLIDELHLKARGVGDSDDEDDDFDRDRFSPPLNVHNENNEYSCGATINSADNNERNNRRALSDSARLASKEEKQRQNEEIVIMESSSISSETGSWESFLPQRGIDGGEPKEMCRSFLSNERRACSSSQTSSPKLSKESTEEKAVESKHDSPMDAAEVTNDGILTPKPTAPIGACFIDASTLLDDGEIEFPNAYAMSPAAQRKRRDSNEEEEEDEEDEDEEDDEPTTTDDKVVVNMSDEQKLINSTKLHDIEYDIKDQYASDSSLSKEGRPSLSSLLNETSASMPSHPTGSRPSHEQERKQGNFLFQNSIQQFSGHVMSPKMAYVEDNNSDFSLPSVYSGGSSDPYNDCASVFDTGSHHSSNYGDRDGEMVQFSIGANAKNDSMLIYPETPHNSILHVNMFHRHSIAPSDSAIASLSSSESTGTSISRTRLHDERDVPIISGGASVKDFTPKQCESLLLKRKTEDCPIISLGGMHSLDLDAKPKPKPRSIDRQSASSAVNSWVVDMSDCNNKKNKRRSSESSSTSTEYSGRYSSVDRSGSASSHKGLGFYVSLSDMKPPRLADEEILSKSLNYQTVNASNGKRKATGFFVDFSNDDSSNASNTPALSTAGVVNSDTDSMGSKNDDKKNMFSMFIDFGAEKKMTTTPNPIAAKRMSVIPKELVNSNDLNGDSSGELSIQLRRNNHTQQVIASDVKRHSWNTSKPSTEDAAVREHKRSTSTSSEKGIMSILDKIPLISKTSSMSIDTPNSPLDDFTCSKSLSSYSNNSLTSLSVHSSNGGGDAGATNNRQNEAGNRRRRQKDARIGETFDKSSQGSLTDGILSKNSSPTTTTDTDDVTYHNENEETVRNGSGGVMETIPETKEAAVMLRRTQHTMETLQATIEKQKQLLNTVTEEPTSLSSSSFVKLSDMDKPIPKFELHNDVRPRSVGSRIGKLFENKFGNRNTWHHMSKSTGNNLTNLASSVENLRSLTRIFPHLGRDLSNSLPTNFEQDYNSFVMSPSEAAIDLFHSDISTSSATSSSISRSGMDSNDEFSILCRQPRRLGEDLLKMFLQEIATDVVIEVNGRRMRAHKCILRSRCQYFAAILAGGWVESAGNVISLSGYSYGAVHFALCHIYSGAAHPPDGISLMELATLADLLGLEGLKEVAAYSLKTNYCHSFHKPCSGCIDGVMQVFPVALNQGLDDLYRKCLRWSCKHSLKVWPSRSFSQLPTELITRCKQHIIAHMTSETVIYTLLDCDQLLALLAPCRWAANVEASVRDIIDAGHDYVVDHFASLIASDGFLSLGQGLNWNISRLENMLLRSGSSLTTDQACRSYQRITRLNSVLNAKINKLHTSRIDKNIFNSDYGNDIDEYDPDEEDDDLDWNPEFIRLVGEIMSAVEQCLIRQCSRAMKSAQWTRMDAALREKIQKQACLSDPVERRPRPVPRANAYISPVITQSSRAHDLYQVKMAIQAHSRRSHEVQSNKMTSQVPIKTNHNIIPSEATVKTNASGTGKIMKSTSKSQVPDLISTAIKTKKINAPAKPERSASTSAVHRRSAPAAPQILTKDKSTASVDSSSLMKKPTTLHEVKSRYLEPKRPATTAAVASNNKDAQLRVRNRSSSGSSRTSSPCISSSRRKDGVMLQNGEKALSDSITMSRDSLASPAKRNEKSPRKTALREPNDQLSVDSLCDSMRSSIISCNKTASHDSLFRKELHKSGDIQPPHPCDKLHPNQPLKSISGNTMQKMFSQSPSINSSTPSSIATLKSRLSTNSTISSPRDNLKTRHTTPANPAPLPVKPSTPKTQQSFLSARSRQILAQKKSTISHSDSSKSVPSALKEKSSPLTSVGVNKSQSTSNILNRRPNPFSTTLHLRRTAKLSPPPLSIYTGKPTTNNNIQHSLMNPTKSSAMKMVSQNNKLNREHSAGKETKTKSSTKRDIVDLDDIGNCADVDEQRQIPSQRTESKLERSSTFCKERNTEIPTSELQIID